MNRIHSAPRSSLLKPTAINTVLADVRPVRVEGKPVVSLMRGEPDFRTPAHISGAAVQALNAGRTTYPDNRGEPGLRDAVALKLARDNGLQYDPGTEILVTTGATPGIHTALMAVLAEGDGVLLPDPVYDAYQSPIRMAGGVIQPVRASIALTASQDCVGEMRRQYAERRSQVLAALDGLPRARALAPEGGFFAMVDVRAAGTASDEIRRGLLHQHGVAVIHGSAYGPGGEGTLRVSSASGGDTLAGGLERLREGLSRL